MGDPKNEICESTLDFFSLKFKRKNVLVYTCLMRLKEFNCFMKTQSDINTRKWRNLTQVL